MIRMGKSSKTNDIDTPKELQNQSANSVLSTAVDNTSNNAFSESELMARDIKEGRLSGFVGSGTVLTGETTFEAMLRVDGHLKGQVRSEGGTLIIGATGAVDANIYVGEALVNGSVNGDISATEKLTLGRSARVVGNIKAPRLIIEDGAVLEGTCSMIESIEAENARIAESQQQLETTEIEEEEPEELASLPEESEETDVDDDKPAVDVIDDYAEDDADVAAV